MRTGVLPTLKLSFDAVFYYARDMERAIEFYRDTLGFRLVSRDAVSRFDLDGVLFEIVPSPQPLSGTGNARLCLRVNDIYDAVAALKGKGVVTSEVKRKPGGLLASFNDPDGNELCLWQYTKE
ncbi:MAG TPA: VOC family protein [Terriglobales bacterium]|nr:VOC family protein [Terriglobales bacterium]